MSYCLIALFYGIVLLLDWFRIRHHIQKRERLLFLILAVLAFASAFPAAHWTRLDHAGASLSGMFSLFRA